MNFETDKTDKDKIDALWSDFEQSVVQKNLSLPQDPPALNALQNGFTFSRYVAQICIQHPDLAVNLLAKGDLTTSYQEDDLKRRCRAIFGTSSPDNPNDNSPNDNSNGDSDQVLAHCPQAPDDQWIYTLPLDEFRKKLRRFRHREMIRIAVRDIGGQADLDTTMSELSSLADMCLQLALDFEFRALSDLWGEPMGGAPEDAFGGSQVPVVLALGKLGARELNFSSDVDLLFAYAHNGTTRGGPRGSLENGVFFERLYRSLIQTVGARTADGFVFRVDARLRPYGESGPLVMTFDQLEAYYEEQGREWERYALIKARPAAGDIAAGEVLLERLRPFVYRRYLDFGAFDSLRDMKTRIMSEVRQKAMEDNIKLGSGGIREIEFFGQMFQLIRGGVDPDLQVRPIRRVLRILVKKGYIPEEVRRVLDSAYLFLRQVENRLQQWQDQQTHQLPADGPQRLRLARSMGFENWPAFEGRIQEVRRQVHQHFDKLLDTDKKEDHDTQDGELQTLTALWQGVADPEQASAFLTRLGYDDPQRVCEEIQSLKDDRGLKTMSTTGRRRLDRLVPLVLRTAADADEPEKVLERLFVLIKSIQKRTSYLALLLENPTALTHLVQLSGESPWISDFLKRHPVLLDELLDPRTLYRPPQKNELTEELSRRLTAAEEEDLEYQMEILRVFKQINVLRVAASDITHVLPLMKVSDHLTDIAEAILEKVVSICWRNLERRHGSPACKLGDEPCHRGFVVVGYGKLGGLELGYKSDLDLVFLHAARSGETRGGTRPMDNTQFFGRLGQRVLHMLTTPTSAGVLYQADMRLRPSGASGMLVSHLDGFRDYQHNDAWTWEHQALIRTRAITGDVALQRRFAQIRHEVLTIKRDGERLRQEVSQMRVRLRSQESTAKEMVFDLKQGLGGIVDIEFIVQYLVLRYAHRHPRIVRWTDNVRLLQALNEVKVIDSATAFGLRRAYLIFRAMVHRLNLRQQPALVEDDRFTPARRFVIRAWNRIMGANLEL